MRRFFLALAAWAVITAPAFALTPTQKIILLGGQHISFTPPLDVLPSAGAAYSVRCLRSAYCLGGGYDMDIRRASDNAQKNIGFVSGNLDTNTASGFCAATTCYVVTWYDQSGNGRDATQATTTAQPKLVLNAIGGRPALSFVGTSSQTLATASFASGTSPQSWAIVAERTGAFTSGAGIATSGVGNGVLFNSSINSVFLSASGALTATAADNVAHSLVGVNNGASSIMSVDGADSTGTDGGDIVASSPIDVGSDGSHFSTSYVAETWTALSLAYSPAQRASTRNNQKAYYGLP